MVQRRAMTKTAVDSQQKEQEPLASESVWAVDICVAHAGEVSGKPVWLQAESTYPLEMYDWVLM